MKLYFSLYSWILTYIYIYTYTEIRIRIIACAIMFRRLPLCVFLSRLLPAEQTHWVYRKIEDAALFVVALRFSFILLRENTFTRMPKKEEGKWNKSIFNFLQCYRNAIEMLRIYRWTAFPAEFKGRRCLATSLLFLPSVLLLFCFFIMVQFNSCLPALLLRKIKRCSFRFSSKKSRR